MKHALRVVFLALALSVAAGASAAAPSESDIDRLTDLVVQAMPLGKVFENVQAADPTWPLGEKNEKATPAQLACLRAELSAEGYRRAKRKDVVTYASAHPNDVADDIRLLESGAAELFGKLVLAGAQAEANGKPADTDAIVAAAPASQGLSMATLATGGKYVQLRRLIGMGSMFDQLAKEGEDKDIEHKGEDQGTQIGAMLMIGAMDTCQLPMSALQ